MTTTVKNFTLQSKFKIWKSRAVKIHTNPLKQSGLHNEQQFL